MCRGLEFMVMCSKKLMSWLVALSSGLSLYAKEWGSSMAPASSFVPRETVPPLSNAPRRETVSHSVT